MTAQLSGAAQSQIIIERSKSFHPLGKHVILQLYQSSFLSYAVDECTLNVGIFLFNSMSNSPEG